MVNICKIVSNKTDLMLKIFVKWNLSKFLQSISSGDSDSVTALYDEWKMILQFF